MPAAVYSILSSIPSRPHAPMVMHTDPHTLGHRIAGLRRAHGWSQRRLAEAAGVSHGYVALLELGRLPSPGKFRLDAVARALNLRTADALLGSAVAPVAEFDNDFDELQPAGRASLPASSAETHPQAPTRATRSGRRVAHANTG